MYFGYYEKEITPPLGGDIPGCYAHRFADAVKDRLFVKAVVLAKDREDMTTATALAVIDAVEISRKQCDTVIKRASECSGIPAGNISVAANHTHWGIPCGDVISYEDTAFTDVCCRLTADCITLACRDLISGSVGYGCGRVENVSFVRDYLLDDGLIVTNPKRSVRHRIVAPNTDPDRELPALFFYNEASEPVACIYSFSLHQCCLGGNGYSGDFSSVVSKLNKKNFGKDFVSLYLAGTSGDVNHIDFINNFKAEYHDIAQKIKTELDRIRPDAKLLSTELSFKKTAVALKRRHASEEELEKAKWILEDVENRTPEHDMTGSASYLLVEYEERFDIEPEELLAPVHVIKLGEAVLFILPGELYSVFGRTLREAVDGKKALVCELANMAAGYIPPAEMLKTKVYPADLCHGSYLEPEAGNKLCEKAIEVLKEL